MKKWRFGTVTATLIIAMLGTQACGDAPVTAPQEAGSESLAPATSRLMTQSEDSVEWVNDYAEAHDDEGTLWGMQRHFDGAGYLVALDVYRNGAYSYSIDIERTGSNMDEYVTDEPGGGWIRFDSDGNYITCRAEEEAEGGEDEPGCEEEDAHQCLASFSTMGGDSEECTEHRTQAMMHGAELFHDGLKALEAMRDDDPISAAVHVISAARHGYEAVKAEKEYRQCLEDKEEDEGEGEGGGGGFPE